jgi:eukaryotic-like serine/threonine-protein kinase
MTGLDELGKRLRAIADVDAAETFARFRAETGSDDLDEFLAYLREKDVISGGAFCALHASAPIRVVAALPAGAGADGHGSSARPIVSDREAIAPASPSAMTVVPVGGAAAVASTAPPAVPGAPQYRILGRIGAGAMGEVHVARDSELGRTVAYKRMVPELAGNAPMIARFYAEAQITAQLDHPNVVSIYDLEVTADRSLGYAMKLVEGKHLGKLIDEGRAKLSVRGARAGERNRLIERLRAFLAVCDAIAFAHSKGVLHRDLKPENIMVGRHGQVYVMDWGISRVIGAPDEDAASVDERAGSGAHGRTRYGAIIGTPGYMSPEQAAGKVPELDGKSDQYALGLILYELVALRQALPVNGTLEETLDAARRGAKAPLGRHVLGAPIDKDLAAIIEKATALQPADRYADVAALARDLRSFLRGDPITARRDGPIERAMRWIGRHKGMTLIILLGVLLFAAAVTIVQLVLHERRLDAAHHRSARIEDYQLAVARQGHEVDAAFFRYEREVARLAGHVTAVLGSSEHGEDRPYLSTEFDTPGAGPTDLAHAEHYGEAASFRNPVFKLAPGVDAAAAAIADELGRLVRLRPAFTALMLGTAEGPSTGSGPAAADATARALILDSGVPAFRTFVTLPSGVHVSYPGMGGYLPTYDGRERHKYTITNVLAPGESRVVWGKPRPDRHGRGLVIAAATRVYAADGAMLGVTGLEMTSDWITENLLPMRDAPPFVDDAYLVDDKGDVVMSTDEAFRAVDAAAHRPNAGEVDDAAGADLDPLPYPAVRDALARGDFGHMTIDVGGAAKVVAFSRIESLRWTYVVIADEARLLDPRVQLSQNR